MPGAVVTTDGGTFTITVFGFAMRKAGADVPPAVSDDDHDGGDDERRRGWRRERPSP